ncbi:MAG: nicotinate (nicotinamide) nucleotide adenylyltransferase [Parafilimonas sp.]
MKIGLFFGSFNPIHIGHLIIANTVINETSLAKIFFIVSPQNPLKKQSELLPALNRLSLTSAALQSDKRFEVSDVEFTQPLPSFTINTLEYFEEKFAADEFSLILGSDSFLNISNWKAHEQLLQRRIIVYERPGYPLKDDHKTPSIMFLKSPLLDISSTAIRHLIKAGKSIRYLVPEAVINEIENNDFYR